MKKSLLLLGILLSTNLYAAKVSTYQEVVSAVENGDMIRININFDLCKPTGPKVLHGIGSYTPNEVLIDMAGDVVATLTHFTNHSSQNPTQPVYEFVRYIIREDNTVNISVNVFDAKTYMGVAEPLSYKCTLNEGATIYAKS